MNNPFVSLSTAPIASLVVVVAVVVLVAIFAWFNGRS